MEISIFAKCANWNKYHFFLLNSTFVFKSENRIIRLHIILIQYIMKYHLFSLLIARSYRDRSHSLSTSNWRSSLKCFFPYQAIQLTIQFVNGNSLIESISENLLLQFYSWISEYIGSFMRIWIKCDSYLFENMHIQKSNFFLLLISNLPKNLCLKSWKENAFLCILSHDNQNLLYFNENEKKNRPLKMNVFIFNEWIQTANWFKSSKMKSQTNAHLFEKLKKNLKRTTTVNYKKKQETWRVWYLCVFMRTGRLSSSCFPLNSFRDLLCI